MRRRPWSSSLPATPPQDDPRLPPAQRWDRRYATRLRESRMPEALEAPDPFLVSVADRLPRRGTALDVAAGLGRHSIWLARRGMAVTAVDLSPVACAHLRARARALDLPITVIERDLEAHGLPPGRFDLVAVVNFLDRRLAPAIEAAVAPDGVLVYTTMTEGGRRPEPVHKEYRLQRGELARLFPRLRAIRSVEDPQYALQPRAGLLAQRPGA